MIQRQKLRLHTSTISHKLMHQKQDKNLKSQLKDFDVDLPEGISAICMKAVNKSVFPWSKV